VPFPQVSYITATGGSQATKQWAAREGARQAALLSVRSLLSDLLAQVRQQRIAELRAEIDELQKADLSTFGDIVKEALL